MTLLPAVLDYLDARQVSAAAIGGVALAAHGIVRATVDADLLVCDRAVLHPEFWSGLTCARAAVRRGDPDDPLAGVVHIEGGAEAVDVVVGTDAWQARALERALTLSVAGHALPTVDRADLVLLKLYAGGPQDVLDVRLLLAADDGTLRREVGARLQDVPAEIGARWRELAVS